MIRPFIAAGLAALALAGCTSSTSNLTPSTSQPPTSPATHTPSGRPFTPSPAATVRPLPYGAPVHKGEQDHRCPYIKTGLNQDYSYTPGVNMADLEGDRIYRTTILTKYHPVGCRFYFYAPPYEAIADILPQRFRTHADAYNAMVLTARAGHNQIPERYFVPGLVGISYQTKFFGPDGAKDWAFVFVKGRTMVIVHTQQSNVSRNALYIGRAIAGKF